MWKKIILAIIIAAFTVTSAACSDGSSKYSTDNLKKFVQKDKKGSKWTPEKRKEILGNLFPK